MCSFAKAGRTRGWNFTVRWISCPSTTWWQVKSGLRTPSSITGRNLWLITWPCPISCWGSRMMGHSCTPWGNPRSRSMSPQNVAYVFCVLRRLGTRAIAGQSRVMQNKLQKSPVYHYLTTNAQTSLDFCCSLQYLFTSPCCWQLRWIIFVSRHYRWKESWIVHEACEFFFIFFPLFFFISLFGSLERA